MVVHANTVKEQKPTIKPVEQLVKLTQQINMLEAEALELLKQAALLAESEAPKGGISSGSHSLPL